MGRYDYSKMMRLKRNIVFTEAPISADKRKVLAAMSRDAHLHQAILSQRSELEKLGIEVLKKKNNILVTREKYYFALYEDELQKNNN